MYRRKLPLNIISCVLKMRDVDGLRLNVPLVPVRISVYVYVN